MGASCIYLLAQALEHNSWLHSNLRYENLSLVERVRISSIISYLAHVTMALESKCCHFQHVVLNECASLRYSGGSCKEYNESLWK